MKRIIYVAGVNRKHLAEQANSVPYWLLSATLLRKYPTWLEPYLRNRSVIWDPGTFTEDCISYQGYRAYIDRHVKSKHQYMQYDEIGNPEATEWYLKDMRRRGYEPIPILQPGGNLELLRSESLVFIGGLVPMDEGGRARYLDEIINETVTAKVHLLGMIKHQWFAPYKAAVQGDNTTWVRGGEYKRNPEIMQRYGEQWIPYRANRYRQLSLF
ncbi:hypothetical protein J2T12_005078 [Paenibacillus anaericanus]|uniref:hypothetical protein n=1 Tax=Paenibacillus anaericanus TaxID=170367 RepID=UPI0027801956|nr:hypothetical protein [Paenibacillus anaericanus]MDQ0091638.1 hypothetical protein [Paenibacillus anaericanus]